MLLSTDYSKFPCITVGFTSGPKVFDVTDEVFREVSESPYCNVPIKLCPNDSKCRTYFGKALDPKENEFDDDASYRGVLVERTYFFTNSRIPGRAYVMFVLGCRKCGGLYRDEWVKAARELIERTPDEEVKRLIGTLNLDKRSDTLHVNSDEVEKPSRRLQGERPDAGCDLQGIEALLESVSPKAKESEVDDILQELGLS